MPSNYLFKLIIIGDVAVGKSCLLLQFLERTFVPDHDVTLGVEFGTKAFMLNNQQVKLHIWDTAGLETFRSITRSYYRGAHGAVLVYDVTRRPTFESLHEWVNDLSKYGTSNLIVTLVGNKSDRTDRQVSREEGEQFARDHHFNFFECSAKTGDNVDEAFIETSRIVLKQAQDEGQQNEEPDESTVDPNETVKQSDSGNGCSC